MFKHPMCGGRHETIGEARACEAGRTKVDTPEEVWPWAADATAKLTNGHATSRPMAKAAYPNAPKPSDRPFKPLGVAYAEALKADPSLQVESPAYSAPRPAFGSATEAQKNFVRVLLAERDWENGLDNDPIARRFAETGEISRDEAHDLIPALKALPKRVPAEPKTPGEQPWKKLSREVPAGYYGVVDAERKNRFYRVSLGRNGFFKVQEQASDGLFFVPLSHYADILQSILDFGLKAAGKFYATEKSCCYRCNRTLTDNTGNPYFALGLGPECGAK